MSYKKEDPEDIAKEIKEWNVSRDDFIQYKKFQYDQSFKIVYNFVPFITFSLGLIIGSLDKWYSLFGLMPLLTLTLVAFVFFKLYMKILNKANEESIKNMKFIYENYDLIKKLKKS